MAGTILPPRTPRSLHERGRMLLLASLVLLTLGAWTLTIYQARTMDMPMGVAVRGEADGEKAAATDDAMVSMPGMDMETDDPAPGGIDGMASVSMSGMSAMGWGWEAFLTFIVAWAVMMAAMMFPSVAPMLLLYNTMATRRQGSGFVPTWVFALGYLTVWTLIGIGTWVVIQVASDIVSDIGLARRETWAPLALGSVLVTAGIYQFTPLKGACLRQCQSPVGFVMTHWRDGAGGALRMGVIHGAYCLGCCWALFAVLVATGVMSLAWMLLLTLVVAAEKLRFLGPRAPQMIGTAFLLFGLLVASGASEMPWMT